MVTLPENWSDWTITGELGSGSFSVVYEASRKDDPSIRCAIKVLTIPQEESEYDELIAEGFSPEMSRSFFDEVIRDFTREIRLMEQFKGMQNIVSIEDYKVVPRENGLGSNIFIRMELLSSLEKYLSDKVLTETEVLQIGADICTALEFCQSKNIIHRDIKPANIFVNDRLGTHVFYKLGDFGIARNLEGKTQGLSARGTPNYMAPEVSGGLPYDATADIYSLGLTLYWLLNGKRLPFFPQTQLYSPAAKREALARRLGGEPLPPPVNAGEASAQVILKACAFKKEDRYQTAREMKNALQKSMQQIGKQSASAPANDSAVMLSSEKDEHSGSQKNGNIKKQKPGKTGMIVAIVITLLVLCGALIAGLSSNSNIESKPSSTPIPASEISTSRQEKEDTPEPAPENTPLPTDASAAESTRTAMPEVTQTYTSAPASAEISESTNNSVTDMAAEGLEFSAEPEESPTTASDNGNSSDSWYPDISPDGKTRIGTITVSTYADSAGDAEAERFLLMPKNIRAKPDPDSGLITTVRNGETYPCYDEQKGTTGKPWYYIWIDKANAWGWISSGMCEFTPLEEETGAPDS